MRLKTFDPTFNSKKWRCFKAKKWKYFLKWRVTFLQRNHRIIYRLFSANTLWNWAFFSVETCALLPDCSLKNIIVQCMALNHLRCLFKKKPNSMSTEVLHKSLSSINRNKTAWWTQMPCILKRIPFQNLLWLSQWCCWVIRHHFHVSQSVSLLDWDTGLCLSCIKHFT